MQNIIALKIDPEVFTWAILHPVILPFLTLVCATIAVVSIRDWPKWRPTSQGATHDGKGLI